MRLLCQWDSPGQNTGVGCCFLFQGMFPTQGLNPGLPHCGWILYHLSHQGSLRCGFEMEVSGGWVPSRSIGKAKGQEAKQIRRPSGVSSLWSEGGPQRGMLGRKFVWPSTQHLESFLGKRMSA